jgi:hypothetical protein
MGDVKLAVAARLTRMPQQLAGQASQNWRFTSRIWEGVEHVPRGLVSAQGAARARTSPVRSVDGLNWHCATHSLAN